MEQESSIDGLVFQEYTEEKTSQGAKRYVKFFLQDSQGGKHLAATGDDTGDAHYMYHSTKPFSKFGPLACHNRKDLIMWLEMVIKESGGVDGTQEGVHIETTEDNPEGLYFVEHKFERAYFPDGRRCNRWFLVDQRGGNHLAVVGIERDTKDGHYSYTAEEPFASMVPLQCSNQGGVYKWLEKMLTHHAGAAAVAATHAATPGGSLAGATLLSLEPTERRAGRPLVLSLGARRGKNAAAEGKSKSSCKKGAAAGAAGHKHALGGIVQQQQAKRLRKMRDEAAAEEGAQRSAQLARLRAAAAAEAAELEAACSAALAWAAEGGSSDEGQMLHTWHEVLLEAAEVAAAQQAAAPQVPDGQETAQAPNREVAPRAADDQAGAGVATLAQAASHLAQHRCRVVLEALKELGTMFVTARMLVAAKVVPTVQRFSSDPQPAIAAAAGRVLRHWGRLLAGHVSVLGNPTYLQDPMAELEGRIAKGGVPHPSLPKARLSFGPSGNVAPAPGATPAHAKPPLPGLTTPGLLAAASAAAAGAAAGVTPAVTCGFSAVASAAMTGAPMPGATPATVAMPASGGPPSFLFPGGFPISSMMLGVAGGMQPLMLSARSTSGAALAVLPASATRPLLFGGAAHGSNTDLVAHAAAVGLHAAGVSPAPPTGDAMPGLQPLPASSSAQVPSAQVPALAAPQLPI